MATFLLTWNPTKFDWSDYPSVVRAVARHGSANAEWSAGGTKQIQRGDRLFLLRQGLQPTGIVGSGVALKKWENGQHWDDSRADETTYVSMSFDRLVDANAGGNEVLSSARLAELVPGLRTNVQRSGTRIADDLALAVEQLWQAAGRLPALVRHDQFPDDLNRADILGAIRYFNAHGCPPTFGESTDYDLVHDGRRYPPKAIAALAARKGRGRMLFSSEFRGGDKTPCFRLLRQHGFQIVEKTESVNSRGHLATSLASPPEVLEPNRYFEGATKTISVNVYERDLDARRACIRHYGCHCLVCGFDFGRIYGPLGEGFIHVHHLKPLSEIGVEYEVDPVRDLRPVCPNCHAMLHMKNPPMEIEVLKRQYQSRLGASVV